MEQLAQKQAEKETRKIIDEMKLQAKDVQLDARMQVIETKLEMTLKAALSPGPR
jgi:vacuolar-type H+-ATPase subunit E/Vma4